MSVGKALKKLDEAQYSLRDVIVGIQRAFAANPALRENRDLDIALQRASSTEYDLDDAVRILRRLR